MIAVITVIGKDRPGIISALTEILYQTGGNLEDASMTILEGEFAMIFLAALRDKASFVELSRKLTILGRHLDLTLSVKELRHQLSRGEKHGRGTVPWVVSVLGEDRAGIVYQVAKVLADRRLNITDLKSKIIGKGSKTAYALVLEVDIPKSARMVSGIKSAFEKLGKKLGMSIAFNPLEASHF